MTGFGVGIGRRRLRHKTFSMRELAARVRAVLRRLEKQTPGPVILRAGLVTLDRTSRSVKAGERAVDLTPSEFDLLATLMASPGRVFLTPGAAGPPAGRCL
jgi:DNA-binding response OmpR family regulator